MARVKLTIMSRCYNRFSSLGLALVAGLALTNLESAIAAPDAITSSKSSFDPAPTTGSQKDRTIGRVGGASLAGLRVTKIAGPETGGSVLDLGKPGAFDEKWVTCPSVLFDGRSYRMWFSSYYDSKMAAGGIGVAESHDGIHWNRLNAGMPVLVAGQGEALDNGQLLAPVVRHDGSGYRMWYTGMPKILHESGIGYYRIFLATSEDGLCWSRANCGKPVLDVGPTGSHDEVQAATPTILKEDNEYLMWYAAWSPRFGHTICRARSRDGVVWVRENGGEPVQGLSPSVAYGPAVCRIGNDYLLLYMASGAETGLYGAVSTDTNHWRMLNDGAPVVPVGSPDAFDASIVGHASNLLTGDRMRIWYTGYRRDPRGVQNLILRIGLAELTAAGCGDQRGK